MRGVGLAVWTLIGSASLQAAEFLPLQNGNTWTYREAVTRQEFSVRVGAPVLIQNQVYYQLTGYVDQPVLARSEGNRLLFYHEEAGGEFPLAWFEPLRFGWWNAHFRACDPVGQTQSRRGIHDGAGDAVDITPPDRSICRVCYCET